MATKKPTITNYRNAEDGRFVTKEYADKHPKTTEKEHNPRPTPPVSPGKKK